MTQSPHRNHMISFLACLKLSGVANPTLKSTVSGSALNKDTSMRYDVYYFPEAEEARALGKVKFFIIHSPACACAVLSPQGPGP